MKLKLNDRMQSEKKPPKESLVRLSYGERRQAKTGCKTTTYLTKRRQERLGQAKLS